MPGILKSVSTSIRLEGREPAHRFETVAGRLDGVALGLEEGGNAVRAAASSSTTRMFALDIGDPLGGQC